MSGISCNYNFKSTHIVARPSTLNSANLNVLVPKSKYFDQ